MVSAAVQNLLDGQSADLSFEQRAEAELAECVSMAKRKTAALLRCACAVGPAFGGGRAEQVAYLRGFGMWSSVSRIFHQATRPHLDELDLSRTLELAALGAASLVICGDWS